VLLISLVGLLHFDDRSLDNVSDYATSSLGALLYLNNWLMVAQVIEGTFIGHTWSLAVEEQFYILWPIILIFLLRRKLSPKRLLVGMAAATTAAAVWRLILFFLGRERELYFGSDGRAAGLPVACTWRWPCGATARKWRAGPKIGPSRSRDWRDWQCSG
jgi:peptidoglycan/LPS O-acetylase OafA/YrhL